ncbi:MAG: hypothetical protein ACJ741_11560 [Pyrinomonadaceae bacterium]
MKSQRLLLVAGVLAAMVLPNIAGCAGTAPSDGTQSGPAQPTPKLISTSDLKCLRWIEGTWRGTGDVEKPFFERYHFENDSTLVVESFSEASLSKVDEVTRFELRDGQLSNSGEGARWVATQLDENSITFEPVTRARNTFRWERQSENLWKAVLQWPTTGDTPAKQKVYQMERLPSPTQ